MINNECHEHGVYILLLELLHVLSRHVFCHFYVKRVKGAHHNTRRRCHSFAVQWNQHEEYFSHSRNGLLWTSWFVMCDSETLRVVCMFDFQNVMHIHRILSSKCFINQVSYYDVASSFWYCTSRFSQVHMPSTTKPHRCDLLSPFSLSPHSLC